MKSVILTFLMFIVIFIILKADAVSIIDNGIFKIASFVLFFAVLGCAVYFVGIPDFRKIKSEMEKIEKEAAKEETKNISAKGKKGHRKA